jgi:transposase
MLQAGTGISPRTRSEVERMLADSVDVVIGVDSHRDSHALALVDARLGEPLVEAQVAANRAGYRHALRLASGRGRRLWVVEGSGSYGAGLARFLQQRGERVLELERPARTGSRGRAKSDALDAIRAARAALTGEPLAGPRSAGRREALRVLLVTREASVAVRRSGLNQLRALVLTAPAELRERLHGLSKRTLVKRCLALRPLPAQEPQLRGTLLALRSCARQVELASREATTLEHELTTLVRQLSPQLLALFGIGPVTAAQLLVSWSHPGRLRSEAAFARLAGVAPIPCSSGKTIRHRLDRGGDRKLNRALHTIVLARRRRDQQTIAFIERRVAEGKSERDAVRSLKRYVARNLYRLLEHTPMPA